MESNSTSKTESDTEDVNSYKRYNKINTLYKKTSKKLSKKQELLENRKKQKQTLIESTNEKIANTLNSEESPVVNDTNETESEIKSKSLMNYDSD